MIKMVKHITHNYQMLRKLSHQTSWSFFFTLQKLELFSHPNLLTFQDLRIHHFHIIPSMGSRPVASGWRRSAPTVAIPVGACESQWRLFFPSFWWKIPTTRRLNNRDSRRHHLGYSSRPETKKQKQHLQGGTKKREEWNIHLMIFGQIGKDQIQNKATCLNQSMDINPFPASWGIVRCQSQPSRLLNCFANNIYTFIYTKK